MRMPDFAVGGLLSAIERMLEQYFDASSSTLYVCDSLNDEIWTVPLK